MNALVSKTEELPLITDIKVRKPLPNEHPLTFDVKIGDAKPEVVKRALMLWEDAVKEAGPNYYHCMTPEQQTVVDEFWKSFDPSCFYEGSTPINGEEKLTVTFNYARDKEEILENIEKLVHHAIHSTTDI